MFDIFSNRELALSMWGIIAFILLSLKISPRRSIYNLYKIVFSKRLFFLYVWMAIYLIPVIYFINKIGLWNLGQIKNTIIWVLFAGLPTIFLAGEVNENKRYFKDALKDIFSLTAVVEFLTNFYSFNLIIELILVPITVLLAGMLVVSKGSEKYLPAAKILNSLLSIFGIFLIGFTLYKLVGNFREFATIGTLTDFLIPPLLTLVFLPFVYLVAVYMNYETNFIALKFSIPNLHLRRFAKRQAILNFNFHTKDLNRWKNTLSKKERNTIEAILASIKEVKTMKATERAPPVIPPHLGWSPYIAKDFLLKEGIVTGYYECLYESEWSASSKYVSLKDALLANNVTYYVTGDNLKVTVLEINLNVNTPKVQAGAHAQLLVYAQRLFQNAFNKNMPTEMVQAILQGRRKVFFEGNNQIILSKQEWMKHINNGYSLKFYIEMKY